MAEVSFFHNERDDNGTRTGLNVNGRRALEQFVPGDGEPDPSLRWYVDAVISTKSPPKTQTAAAVWLAKHSAQLKRRLKRLLRSWRLVWISTQCRGRSSTEARKDRFAFPCLRCDTSPRETSPMPAPVLEKRLG